MSRAEVIARFALLAGLIGLAGGITEARAEEAEGQGFRPELWVNAGGISRHFDRTKNFNERNEGLGVEYRWRDDASVMLGQYRNSMRDTTHYAALNYQPLQFGPLKVGASIGVMDGYRLMRNGGNFFAALPMVTYEGERFGVNVGVIPNVPSKHVDGCVLVQIKFKAF